MKLFDSHFHIIDKKFPLLANQGFLPDEFTVQQYRQQTASLSICAGAVVSGSFQAFDQSYLKAALKQLGPDFVGVTQLPASVSDAEICELHQAGVRAIRFNLHRGGSADNHDIASLAQRVYQLVGWHSEFYVDSAELKSLYPLLADLPAISIDHLGLSRTGLTELLKLVEQGARVKATGFGRVNFDVRDMLHDIATVNADALMFGTDLPCTRAPRAFSLEDINLIRSLFSSTLQEKVFYSNAASFYRSNATRQP